MLDKMTLEDYLAENMNSDAASTSSEVEDDQENCESEVSAAAWGMVLAGALRRASRQGRLTCGITAAAQVLEQGSPSVRLCVLAPPSSRGGGLLHLHSVLLEAHCYENDIPTIKVDSMEKLAAIVGPSCECVLVHSSNSKSKKMHDWGKHGQKEVSKIGEKGLLAAAQSGVQPSVLVLPVTPPP